MSSVATLGKTDRWLKTFFDALAAAPTTKSKTHHMAAADHPKYSIIYPTADEIRRSLNGYVSGGSIHMKLRTPAQQSQLQYLRPYLCEWAGDGPADSRKRKRGGGTENEPGDSKHTAGRRRAAPHIKTYFRFSDSERMDDIQWAMVTSANLSTQAWGHGINAQGEVFISSWEIGVVLWPGLFSDGSKVPEAASTAKMVPCFGKDRPDPVPMADTNRKEEQPSVVVGFRMPYDLPLTPYGAHDVPWSADEFADD